MNAMHSSEVQLKNMSHWNKVNYRQQSFDVIRVLGCI
jgi:hypothetical protein